ncbi:hypothetical protein L596_023600 [Steinernema carpocapsae]|uniref:Uncharacterized protein n=1 Tax=Steinernema carpocapsae TaxID=34508 RepID=A0A4U5ME52_STECR|nr:hypothetical protein L596_023600 [Steinernema carpocapsae]
MSNLRNYNGLFAYDRCTFKSHGWGAFFVYGSDTATARFVAKNNRPNPVRNHGFPPAKVHNLALSSVKAVCLKY